MEGNSILPLGRAFEEYVFGVSGHESVRPAKKSLKTSMYLVIRDNWRMYSNSLDNGPPWHNPSYPTMGKTGQLWKAVKKNLPRRVLGRKAPLDLHIAVGGTSLDWHYGADAFFWWQGAFVTFDASLISEEYQPYFKANFLLGPDDLLPESLDNFGFQVSQLLRLRSNYARRMETRGRRKEINSEFFKNT